MNISRPGLFAVSIGVMSLACFMYGANALALKTDTIKWIPPQKIEHLGIIKKSDGGSSSEDDVGYFRVGQMVSGKYKGGEIITASVSVGLGTDYLYHIIKKSGTYILLKKYSIGVDAEDNPFDMTRIKVDTSYVIPSLEFPKTLKGPQARQVLTGGTWTSQLFSKEDRVKVFTHKLYGNVYESSKGYFYVKSPSGGEISYEFKPDFKITMIKWNSGQKKIAKESDYSYQATGGCGMSSIAIATLKPNVAKLTKVGINDKKDAIYFLKNSNDALLKDMYNSNGVDAAQFTSLETQQSSKISYKQFLSIRPAFFWIDPFGRLIQYQSSKVVSFAECGKPVIYLYPPYAQDVAVSLSPQGGFTKSEPLYGNGWLLFVEPNGIIVDRQSGKKYPYLFWEGRGNADASQETRKGFVVAKENVHEFLLKKLAKLGLRGREISDFIEFWEPRMQSSPYYAVRFYGNKTMDQIAPLSTTPKPDVVIRVLMDFTSLAVPIVLEPQLLPTPERNGFTVVEWGGVIR